jgi:hypothetical protein
MLIVNAIILGFLILALGGVYLWWIWSEKNLEQANAKRNAEWNAIDEAERFSQELEELRRDRVPLAERIREMSFDHVRRFGVREVEIISHPLD